IPPDFIQKFNKRETAGNFIFYRFPPVIASTKPGSVADKMGLKSDDRIVATNDTPITYYDEISTFIRTAKADTLTVTVQRGGKTLTFTEDFRGQEALGVYAKNPEDFFKQAQRRISYGFFESIPKGTERAFTTLAVQVKAFGKIISGALSPKESLSGP